ncbi:MAG: aldo/keto reductase [Verrucomicrobiota bacterium]
MDLTKTAYGTWSGGRFMHFGEAIDDERMIRLIQRSHERGVRSFLTADVYGGGQADTLLGNALAGIDRDSYCLVGAVGHDFYEGQRAGSKGYPRFTDPALRGPDGYADYLKMATEKSLERCQASHFDLLLLHNPDSTGFTHEAVWEGMSSLKAAGLVHRVGIAPGPANGFTLDLIECFEKFGSEIDWAMVILNPLEPWPGRLPLAAAAKQKIKVLTRVVDYGGLFHDDVKEGHPFKDGDHRTYRPEGWVEHGREKMEPMRPYAEKNGLTMLQLACLWNLAQEPVESVVPTLIQEPGDEAKTIEQKLDELAALPDVNPLTAEEVEAMAAMGDNEGCMMLKGADSSLEGEPGPDRWPLRPELAAVASRWGLSGSQW